MRLAWRRAIERRGLAISTNADPTAPNREVQKVSTSLTIAPAAVESPRLGVIASSEDNRGKCR